jgi:gliding motility-associated-like protein
LAIFLFNAFLANSQIVSGSVRALNCNHDGAIFLDVIPGSLVNWYFDDDSLGLISVGLMQDILFNNLDTLFTQQCGSYKVVYAGDTSFFFVGCPLGSAGSQVNIKCFDDSTGMLKRVAHSGSSPYFYEWFKNGILYSSGSNDTLLSNLTVGSFKLVINDNTGCVDSLISTISSPVPLIVDTIFNNNINCRGANSGSLISSVSGGRQYSSDELYNYYIINLNSGDTVSLSTRDSMSLNFSYILTPYRITFDSLFAGEYILSIVDSFNCILDTIFEIKEPSDYITYGSTTDILICESDSSYLKIDSVIVDSILGSQNIIFGFAYDLINGIHMDSIYASSGWYDIYIYDSIFFCLDTVPVRCESLYEIKVFESISSVLCFGDQSGSVIIDSIIGGNIPYDIQWGGANSSALSAGAYSVHIVDSIGCLHTELYVITEGIQINPNEVLYHPLCYGDSNGNISIDITGGTGPLYYYWLNNSSTVDSLYSLDDGVYPLIVVDDVGCSDTFNLSLQSPQLLQVDLTAMDSVLSCFGAFTLIEAVAFSGTYPYLINWSDGDTNMQRIEGAGYYNVEILDVNGCLARDSILIVEPDSLDITISNTNVSCYVGAIATVNATGGSPFNSGPPYTYLWSTGDTTNTIDSLYGGIYWVKVTDSCGSIFDTLYLNDYELNTIVYYDSLTHTALVNIESASSQGPFGYVWLDTLCSMAYDRFPSYDSISPFLCGNCEYFVNVIDSSNNCIVTNNILVPIDNIPLSIIDLTSTTVDTANLLSLWGSPPYNFLWNDSLWSTTYYGYPCPNKDSSWVEITDSNKCLIVINFLIAEIAITLNPEDIIIRCDIENLDIDLEALATGGTGSYSYQWWNGTTKNPINLGMNPGKFSVTVTDVNGCIADTSFMIATMTSECVPNVFTPNGDSQNDTWSLEDTFLYEDSEVRIYGRFGKLIFKSVGYHNAWDGTNKKGKNVPAGAYFYSIEIGHGFDQINGSVTILR